MEKTPGKKVSFGHFGSLHFMVGEHAVAKPPKGGGPYVSEDLYTISLKEDLPYFAMLDGHNGINAASFAQKGLYTNLKQNLGSMPIDEAINAAFSKTGEQILNLQKNKSGSTASIAFFTFEEGEIVLHIANIGDSSIFIGSKEPDGWYATTLTESHRYSDEKEAARTRAMRSLSDPMATPKRKPSQDSNKLNGSPPKRFFNTNFSNVRRQLFIGEDLATGLNPNQEKTPLSKLSLSPSAPATGQTSIEQPKPWDLRTGLKITRAFGHPHLIEKGLLYTPAINHLTIRPNHQFLVLMTDGVSDHLDADDAVKFVAEKLALKMTMDEIAEKLIIAAAFKSIYKRPIDETDYVKLNDLKTSIKDDMTVVIVKLEQN
jgi:serine/threonine protein phosphatase PrpC